MPITLFKKRLQQVSQASEGLGTMFGELYVLNLSALFLCDNSSSISEGVSGKLPPRKNARGQVEGLV